MPSPLYVIAYTGTMNCAKCGGKVTDGDEVKMKHGDPWCQDCYGLEFHNCDNCSEETLLSEIVMVKTKSELFSDGILNTCKDCVEPVKAKYGEA